MGILSAYRRIREIGFTAWHGYEGAAATERDEERRNLCQSVLALFTPLSRDRDADRLARGNCILRLGCRLMRSLKERRVVSPGSFALVVQGDAESSVPTRRAASPRHLRDVSSKRHPDASLTHYFPFAFHDGIISK